MATMRGKAGGLGVAGLVVWGLVCATHAGLVPHSALLTDADESTEGAPPVIGVLTMELDATTTFVYTSHVKLLESAGARVVPLLSSSTKEELTQKFQEINGLYLPGGMTTITDPSTPFMANVVHLLTLARKTNEGGGFFPVWGTCLGLQEIVVFMGGPGALSTNQFDAMNLPSRVSFTGKAALSRMFAAFPAKLRTAMSEKLVIMNNHHDGLVVATFEATPGLKDAFDVLATQVDRNGKEVVAVLEGKTLPFYAVQFHPEMPAHQWKTDLNIPRSPEAVAVGWNLAMFFVSEARKSSHTYPAADLAKDIIFNDPQTFSPDTFEQRYLFQHTA